ALTLCAAPHRAPHFSFCFFFFAASQPTGSAATLLPPPPPLFLLMAMTLTVRRRAVCALALLALLCSSFVCEANPDESQTTGDVNVSVEVSCPTAGNKLRWRLSGTSNSSWAPCPFEIGNFLNGGSDKVGASLCLFAGSLYEDPASNVKANCPSFDSAAGGTGKAAFTMNCATDESSALYNLSKGATAAATTVEESYECALQTVGQVTAQRDEGASRGEKGTGAKEQPPIQAAAPPVGTAEGEARGSGEADASLTHERPSGAPHSATTTTTTTRSPSAGKHTKSNADSSDTLAAAWVRAPMLLLTAALACAAGQL
ncbi:putative mucin-like glycoprotein, partial [Trypanosoma conorhini]